MRKSARRPPKPVSTFLRLFAALAFVAQIAVVLAPVAEGRDGVGMAAHVESGGGGNPSHHAHNESTCIACQARGFHGVPLGAHVAPPPAAQHMMAPILASDRVVASTLVRRSLPRAPPA